MTDQVYSLKMITDMNSHPLHQHTLTLLRKENRSVNGTTLYLAQAAALIPQLLMMDENRPAHQKLIRFLTEELPLLHPNLQMSAMMGLHQSWTENDSEEMRSEMMGVTELDELALLIADNLLGVLGRE